MAWKQRLRFRSMVPWKRGTMAPRKLGSGVPALPGTMAAKKFTRSLSSIFGCDNVAAMSKAVSRRTTRKQRTVVSGLTANIPAPPVENATENLSVEIQKQVGWRLKMALWQFEVEGHPSTKKAFVENAIVSALDEFERLRKGRK